MKRERCDYFWYLRKVITRSFKRNSWSQEVWINTLDVLQNPEQAGPELCGAAKETYYHFHKNFELRYLEAKWRLKKTILKDLEHSQ